MSRILKYSFALITLLTANMASAASSNPAERIHLNKVDPRVIKNVTVAVSYQISGHLHYDWEAVGTWDQLRYLEIRQTTGTQDAYGIYRGDFLHTTSTGAACSSDCTINIEKTDPRTFTDLVVEISFTVGGSSLLHYDSEAAPIPGPPAFGYGEDFLLNLDVDGRNATFDGSEYRGNLLSTPPQVASFYWDLNQLAYNSELWGAGFTPYTNAWLYFEDTSFGNQLLYNMGVDGNGVVHNVYQTNECARLKMRASDYAGLQKLHLFDSAGRETIFWTNVIRACNYFH